MNDWTRLDSTRTVRPLSRRQVPTLRRRGAVPTEFTRANRDHSGPILRSGCSVAWSRLALIVALGWTGAHSPSLLAADLEIAQGADIPVCNAYAQNLAESLRIGNMIGCERKIYPSAGLRAPDWTRLNLREHLSLLKETQIGQRLAEVAALRSAAGKQESSLFEEAERSQVALSVADVDLNNDGTKDKVLAVHSRCGIQPESPRGVGVASSIYFVTKDLRHVDKHRQDLGWRGNSTVTVFTHMGTTYVDTFVPSDRRQISGSGELQVFRGSPGGTETVCVVRYQPN